MALAALPGLAATLQPKALLTVSGRIGQVNNKKANTYDFSEADFLKLRHNQYHDRYAVDPDLGLCRPFAGRCHASRRRHLRCADVQDP